MLSFYFLYHFMLLFYGNAHVVLSAQNWDEKPI